ncbi:MAG TPA: hypothetical protein VM680_01845, partial [Verrucomicrobiae bacterium]|nr:hypothetical protein [Verrucomicrobiae bacterium]
ASSPLFVTTQGEKPLVCVFQQPIFQPGFPPLPPMPPLYGVFRLNADTSAVPLIAGLQEEIITETAGAFWKVAPTGAGPFTYQWRKNEIDIPGATQDEFKIDSASTTDSGSYSVVVANAQGIAVGDPLTLTVLPPTPGTVFQDLLPPPGNNNPFVESISMAPDGKLFIPHGGPSVVVNGELQSSAVKRLLPNGQIDPTFGPALWGSFGDGIIRSIGFQSDGKILIAGSLIQLYGTGAHQGVVRFNQDGTRDEIFDADGVGSSDELFAMIVRSDDRILLGGRTRDYDSIPLGNLFRATAQGAADLDFNFAATGALGSAGSYVRDFAALPDGRIYAVGTFTTYNGMDANGALLIDPDGGLITTFASELTGIQSVTACAVQQDEKLIIAGKFIQADQTVGVVRLNRDGSLDTSFNLLPFDGEINDIVVQGDGKIIIGGDFTEIGGTPEKNLARLNADGSLDQSFDVGSGPDGVVQALLLTPEERLWVGGQFGTFGGLPRMGLARVNIGRLQKINSITASITTKATVTFRWDDDTYTLQFTDSLASGVWTDLPNKSGIEIDATAPSRFFRLHHQP